MNYSKGELEAMTAAFAHHFNVDLQVARAQAAQDWILESATVIVEYDGYLHGEDATGRNERMEMVDVYDGQVKSLVSYLRHLYPEKSGLPKWALIFSTHNEIIDVRDTIERAKLEHVFGASDGSDETSQTSEVAQVIPDTSNEEAEAVVTTVPDEDVTAPIESVHTEPEHEVEAAEQSVGHREVVETPDTDDTSETPSGNVHAERDSLLFNRQSKMEVKEMAEGNVQELLAAATGAVNASAVGQEQAAPASNTAATKTDIKAAQMAVSKAMGIENEERQAWTRNNTVTAIVSTQKPAAERRTADQGTVGTESDPNKLNEAINGKVLGFIASVTGRKGLTIDQFEALPESERYVNVVNATVKVNDIEVSNVDKAKAIYELLKAVKQNPTMAVQAFIPSKLSYPIKGYAVAGKAMSTDEFMLLLTDKSNGAIYAQGGVNADGVEVDGATSFRIMSAKKAERAQAGAIKTQAVERRVPVIRVKNKSAFIAGGKNVMYLFPNEDAEAVGTAAFRAAINVNGALVPAGVTVYSLDDEGNKVVISHNDKDNTDRYKTKQASVSVSVPVKKVLREFDPQFKGEDDTVVAAGRWGVNMGAGKTATGDWCNVKDFSKSPVYDVFVAAYAGNLSLPGAMKDSVSMQKLRAAANQAAAEDAAEAAEALD